MIGSLCGFDSRRPHYLYICMVFIVFDQIPLGL